MIDRKEARELFKRVVEPETREIVDLYDTFYSRFHKRDFSFQGIPQVEYFCELSENCDEQYGSKEEECDDERGHEGTAVANGADKKTDSRANKRNKKGSKQNDPIPDQAEQIN